MPNNGTEFVASIEAKKYPIYATQFHPEKPSSLWAEGYKINHSWQSIMNNGHFGEYFVSLARQNNNTFGSYTDYQKYDISNYDTEQTTSMGLIYVFP